MENAATGSGQIELLQTIQKERGMSDVPVTICYKPLDDKILAEELIPLIRSKTRI